MQGASFTIIGKVDHLSDTKTTEDGKLIQPVVVRVTKKYRGSDGEPIEKVAVLTVMTIGDVAESIGGLKSGDPVYAQGNLTSREWQDKNIMNLWANTVVKLVSAKLASPQESSEDDDSLPF